MSMKKIMSLALALTMATALAACGGAASSASASGSTSGASSVATSGAASSTAPAKTLALSEGLDKNGLYEGVKALDYVTLPTDYKAIAIPADKSTITDATVQEQVDGIVKSFATKEQLKEGVIADKTTVNIDYVGSIDGKEFDGGSTGGAGSDVTVGTTQFIDDFIEQLIGHKPGDKFDITVTFPADYGNETLNGKDAVFAITINHIVGEDIIPVLNDAFVAENLTSQYGWKTEKEMREDIKTTLQKNSEMTYLWEHMTTGSTVKEVPQAVLDYQKKSMINAYESMAAQYGITVDEMIAQTGAESMDAFIESQASALESTAKESLIVQAIAEDAKLTIDDKAVASFFEKNYGSADYSQYETNFGMSYLKMVARDTAAKEFLLEKATRA